MEYLELYKQAISEKFKPVIAMSAVLIYLLNDVKKTKQRHVKTPGRFEKELLSTARDVLSDISDDRFEQAWWLYSTFHVYLLRKSMDGIGGCTKISMRDLYKGIKELNARTP